MKVGGKDWKKGKVKLKIVVEFYPDEPNIDKIPTSDGQKVNQAQSSLDDIRLMVDKLS